MFQDLCRGVRRFTRRRFAGSIVENKPDRIPVQAYPVHSADALPGEPSAVRAGFTHSRTPDRTAERLSWLNSLIDQHGVTILKGEDAAPIAIHRDRLETGRIASEVMQSPARQVHILRPFGDIQAAQQAPQLRRVVRLDSAEDGSDQPSDWPMLLPLAFPGDSAC